MLPPASGPQAAFDPRPQYASGEAYQAAVDKAFGQSRRSDCTSQPGEQRYDEVSSGGHRRTGWLQCSTHSDKTITFIASTDELWMMTVVDTDPRSGWSLSQMKGAWQQNLPE